MDGYLPGTGGLGRNEQSFMGFSLSHVKKKWGGGFGYIRMLIQTPVY